MCGDRIDMSVLGEGGNGLKVEVKRLEGCVV